MDRKKLLSTALHMIVALLLAFALTGCSSFAKGIAEAVIESEQEDTRQCWALGRPFEGLNAMTIANEPGEEESILKILTIHGIGTHKPGYSSRLVSNLVADLQLNRVKEDYSSVNLRSPLYEGVDLGALRVSMYTNSDHSREVHFYELTWDPIVEEEKQKIAFDNSTEYSFRRADFNNSLKLFVNDTVPDVLMYTGRFRGPLQASVGQSLCLMMTDEWDSVIDDDGECAIGAPDSFNRLQDNYVFISHSMGSRIIADALQRLSSLAHTEPTLNDKLNPLQEKRLTVFMLSNQLPLLQLGQPDPEFKNDIASFCGPNAKRSEERLFEELRVVAISDPNDLFSYPLTKEFIDSYVDSRLCPTLTNVEINVAHPKDVFGLGKLANPLTAHTEYENDERVIDLITKGLGQQDDDVQKLGKCKWMQAVPDEDWEDEAYGAY